MWELTKEQVKYLLRIQIYRDVDGKYYRKRKRYATGTYNKGWVNLIPGGPNNAKYTKKKETLDTNT